MGVWCTGQYIMYKLTAGAPVKLCIICDVFHVRIIICIVSLKVNAMGYLCALWIGIFSN